MATERFEYFAFQDAWSELKQKLAELRYIDDALAYLTAEDHTGGATVEFVLGASYPFTAFGSPPDMATPDSPLVDGLAAAERHLEVLESEARSWAYGSLAALYADDQELIHIDTDEFGALVDAITASVLHPLIEGVEGDVGRLGTTLGQWRGNAAVAFDRNFYAPFGEVRDAHTLAIDRLAGSVGIAKAVVDSGRHSVMNAVVTMRDAVDAQLRQRQAKRQGVVSAETLQLATTAIAVIGAVASLVVPPVGVVTAVATRALAHAEAGLPEEAQEAKQIPVVTALDSLAALESLLLGSRVNYLGQMLRFEHEDLFPLRDSVVEDEAAGRLYPPRPALHGVPPEDFHHESSGQY